MFWYKTVFLENPKSRGKTIMSPLNHLRLRATPFPRQQRLRNL